MSVDPALVNSLLVLLLVPIGILLLTSAVWAILHHYYPAAENQRVFMISLAFFDTATYVFFIVELALQDVNGIYFRLSLLWMVVYLVLAGISSALIGYRVATDAQRSGYARHQTDYAQPAMPALAAGDADNQNTWYSNHTMTFWVIASLSVLHPSFWLILSSRFFYWDMFSLDTQAPRVTERIITVARILRIAFKDIPQFIIKILVLTTAGQLTAIGYVTTLLAAIGTGFTLISYVYELLVYTRMDAWEADIRREQLKVASRQYAPSQECTTSIGSLQRIQALREKQYKWSRRQRVYGRKLGTAIIQLAYCEFLNYSVAPENFRATKTNPAQTLAQKGLRISQELYKRPDGKGTDDKEACKAYASAYVVLARAQSDIPGSFQVVHDYLKNAIKFWPTRDTNHRPIGRIGSIIRDFDTAVDCTIFRRDFARKLQELVQEASNRKVVVVGTDSVSADQWYDMRVLLQMIALELLYEQYHGESVRAAAAALDQLGKPKKPDALAYFRNSEQIAALHPNPTEWTAADAVARHLRALPSIRRHNAAD
jgi:hypothetical protein